MIKIEEKLELAKSLGLENQISILEYKSGMFDLKFKPITFNEIKKRLKIRWNRALINCWVDDFQFEIPYGAMLALKEAGEKGIMEHRVWYPIKTNPIKDYFRGWNESDGIPPVTKDDPIITGIDSRGRMIEIFAWNEDDVY